MPRFFVKASQIGVRDDGQKTVLIIGDDAAHITKSLRMKQGEGVCVCDMARREYDCTVVSVGEEVLLSVEGERECDTEPPYFATLYQQYNAITPLEDYLLQKFQKQTLDAYP